MVGNKDCGEDGVLRTSPYNPRLKSAGRPLPYVERDGDAEILCPPSRAFARDKL